MEDKQIKKCPICGESYWRSTSASYFQPDACPDCIRIADKKADVEQRQIK